MYKVDLHTHSVASLDGGITEDQFRQTIESGLLDCIAITDHGQIDFALSMRQALGDHIIVGEEIMTQGGEIIGLFLSKVIESGLTPEAAIKRIKQQDGIAYVPHPFETVRKGLLASTLNALTAQIDIIETCNGRAFVQNRSQQAILWAKLHNKIGAAGSDAHGLLGLGKTYTVVSQMPNRSNLLSLLESGRIMKSQPSLRSLLYPNYHRLKKKVRKSQ